MNRKIPRTPPREDGDFLNVPVGRLAKGDSLARRAISHLPNLDGVVSSHFTCLFRILFG